ncbi:MAG TPA: hypothetical protein VFQ06_08365 [Nitrospira sp.]|nr:hypothetical protein [Nitrospira sp.]
MVRSSIVVYLLLILAICGVQIMGAVCSDDCREWSSTPLEEYDLFPGTQESQTEPDSSEGESALELALAQGDGLSVIQRTSSCVMDTSLRPQHAFLSDWFRPPTRI